MKATLRVISVEPEGDETVLQVQGNDLRGVLVVPSTKAPRIGDTFSLDVAESNLRSRLPPRENSNAAKDAEEKGKKRPDPESQALSALLFGRGSTDVSTERDVDAEMDALLGPANNRK